MLIIWLTLPRYQARIPFLGDRFFVVIERRGGRGSGTMVPGGTPGVVRTGASERAVGLRRAGSSSTRGEPFTPPTKERLAVRYTVIQIFALKVSESAAGGPRGTAVRTRAKRCAPRIKGSNERSEVPSSLGQALHNGATDR